MSVKAVFRQVRLLGVWEGALVNHNNSELRSHGRFASHKAWWTQKEEREASIVKDGSNCIYMKERSQEEGTHRQWLLLQTPQVTLQQVTPPTCLSKQAIRKL